MCCKNFRKTVYEHFLEMFGQAFWRFSKNLVFVGQKPISAEEETLGLHGIFSVLRPRPFV